MANFSGKDWELVTAVLEGELDEQDAQFQCWLATDRENAVLYEQLQQVKMQAEAAGRYQDFETARSAMWQTVKTATIAAHTARRAPRFSLFTRYAAAAAILLVVAGGAWYWISRGLSTDTAVTAAVNNPTAPVTARHSTGASLRLSNGKQIDLDQAEQLQEKDGTLLSAGKQHGLRYTLVEDEYQAPVYNTLLTAKGGAYVVTLSDGTRVWLNAVSELTYPTRFSGATREVELKGEAYFEVTSDARQPFIVKTATTYTRVTGTSFNIYAYEGEPVAATLVEGGISFTGGKEGAQTIQLQPSQQAVYTGGPAGSAVGSQLRKVDADIYTSWKEGALLFENERLELLLRKLDRWYDFNVQFADPALKELRFTGRAGKSMSLSYILDLVSLTTKVRFTFDKENNRVLVQSK